MKKRVRFFALALALLMLVPIFAACKKDNEPGQTGGEKGTGALIGGDIGEGQNSYADVDFGGRVFKIHMNKNEDTYSTSSQYIASVAELSPEISICEKAVFERDAWMRENLNMGIEYTIYDAPYGNVAESIRKQLQGDSKYDLYIDKLYPMANLSLEGSFNNIAGRMELQYFEKYWYNDYMNSLSLDDGSTMFLLAGDFFMDVLRSSNVMFVNLEMMQNRFEEQGGSDAFLTQVIEGNWTYDNLITYVKEAYQEGNGVDVNTMTFGLLLRMMWEPLIPMLVSSGVTFAEQNDEGNLVPAVNTERNAKIFEKLNELFYLDGAGTCVRNMSNDLGLNEAFGVGNTMNGFLDLFIRGKGLFSYGRFASMEKLGQSELKYSVIPYPKFMAGEDYVTATHDTTEIGAIPSNAVEDGVILQMLDIMSDLTSRDLMYVYYEEMLKLRYSTDEKVSAIIDIIHNNMSSGFALAYNDACNTALLWRPFYEPLRDGRNFQANYPSVRNSLESGLKSLMDKWNAVSGG